LIYLLATDLVVIDLSSREEGILEWDDDIEKLVVKRLLQKIYEDSCRYYREERSLNCLVMLDEAHRFANKEVDSSREKTEIGDKRGIVATLVIIVLWFSVVTSSDI
jgi:hypothetical protein